MGYVREHFVEGRFTTAKALLLDCVVVAQNRNCIILLEKANYCEGGEGERRGGIWVCVSLLQLKVRL